MFSEAVVRFQRAMEAMSDAESHAEEVMDVLHSAGQAAAHWKRLVVTNLNPAVTSGGSLDPTRPQIDATRWPTADEIATVLRNWRDTRTEARNAWNAIPEDARRSMKDPGLG
jgi:hypothetical protein